MPGASSRMRTPRYKTERLDLQAIPQTTQTTQREQGAVATIRILRVGATPAARSGSTWQIPGPVQPGQPIPEPPHVIYARPVRPTAPRQEELYEPQADDRSLFDTPRQHVGELQLRAARALSGLHANLSTQRIEVGTWSKPSSLVMCVAVGMYTLALFLFALLGR